MAKTKGTTRYYRCKRCSADTEEPLRSWKQKPQKLKNVCPFCIKKQQVAAQTRREIGRHAGYGFFTP